jgi:putative phage-type endonuclease
MMTSNECRAAIPTSAMRRETIAPLDRAEWLALRTQDITSTEVSALFGMSPYETAFELWHRKRDGEDRTLEDDERRRRGRLFEPVIAQYVAQREGWTIRPMPEYVRVSDLRIGSSFDFRVMTDEPVGNDMPRDRDDDSILEIKRVNFLRFDEGWCVDDDWTDAPAHIELQVQHQMLVSGLRMAYIAVDIAGRDETRILRREADDAVHMAIMDRVAAFWQSIADGVAPDPVYPQDAAAVIRMHQFAEPGKLLDASGDADLELLLTEYDAARIVASRADNEKESLKARILAHIGDYERVIMPGWSISAGVTAPSDGTLVTQDMVGTYVGGRRAFRGFRVTAKKQK